MTRDLVLTEYERSREALTAGEVERLVSAGGDALRVESTPVHGTYDVVANSRVGTLVTADLQVLIRPKVRVENVLYLMGFSVDDIQWWQEHFPYEVDRHLVPALLAFFARTLRQALGAGLIRSYQWEEERLATIRGRIDLSEYVRSPQRPFPVPCSYEDYTADNLLNRFLKAAVRSSLMTTGITPSLRLLLLGEMAHFDEVADVPMRPEALDGHVFTRLDRHYETPIELARLILQRRTIADRLGASAASSFLIDMNQLFEDFVAEGLRDRLAPTYGVHRQVTTHLDLDRQVAMKPDVLVSRAGRRVYVGDVKYKLNASGIARNPDYYQLLAYATALGHEEGLLIYYRDGDERPPREITVRGTGTRIVTYRLDLSGSPREIEHAVDELADLVRGRVHALAGPFGTGKVRRDRPAVAVAGHASTPSPAGG
jgi:5-methylcytosine-specific restriction enzyme subunit McrC